MEKIKDIIYDYSDVFLAMVITAVMVVVVYVHLNTIFDDSAAVVPFPSAVSLEDVQNAETPLEEIETIIIDLSEPTSVENAEIEDSGIEELAESAPSTPPSPPTPTTPPVTGEMVSVTIPNGTPGIGIARILVKQGLLPDTTPFVQAAESLNLSLKLKSGTFRIPAGSSPEQMVRIIAGQ